MTGSFSAKDVGQALRFRGSPVKARKLSRFFKSAPGEYGEGDRFLGVTVPEQRCLSRQFSSLSLGEVDRLLRSPWHEERLTGLLILINQHERASRVLQKRIFRFFLDHRKFVNNWDLVDLSASILLGPHVDPRKPDLLKRWAGSPVVWERRMAVVATFHFIKEGDPCPTLVVAKRLLGDSHDLIHKAVGWMLREVGKRCSLRVERAFLDQHAAHMPRTMLRYAIERFPASLRAHYMKKGIPSSSASSRRVWGRPVHRPR